METGVQRSDEDLIALLRRSGPLGIAELVRGMGVTSNAVRQRLSRLLRLGLVERTAVKATRGRPSHRYLLTEKGRRRGGSNFVDLALALWQEVREIKDREVRTGLLERLATAMSSMYAGQVQGATTAERMQSVSALFEDRGVALEVQTVGELPVLNAVACPYPELAEKDRSICAVEKMLFSQLLGEKVRLTDYRLEGAACCRFETN